MGAHTQRPCAARGGLPRAVVVPCVRAGCSFARLPGYLSLGVELRDRCPEPLQHGDVDVDVRATARALT